MNACPACSQPVAPNDVTCPKCGISLHHETATAGPASGNGKGLSVVAIVIFALIGVVLLVGCLGVFGFRMFAVRMQSASVPATVPVPAGVPYSAGPPVPIDSQTTTNVDLEDPPAYVPPEKDPGDGP